MARVMLLCAAIMGVVAAIIALVTAFSPSAFVGLGASAALVAAVVVWDRVERRRAAVRAREVAAGAVVLPFAELSHEREYARAS